MYFGTALGQPCKDLCRTCCCPCWKTESKTSDRRHPHFMTRTIRLHQCAVAVVVTYCLNYIHTCTFKNFWWNTLLSTAHWLPLLIAVLPRQVHKTIQVITFRQSKIVMCRCFHEITANEWSSLAVIIARKSCLHLFPVRNGCHIFSLIDFLKKFGLLLLHPNMMPQFQLRWTGHVRSLFRCRTSPFFLLPFFV